MPQQWAISGEKIGIEGPTRWGRVSFALQARPKARSIVGLVELAKSKAPREVHLNLRLPPRNALRKVTVNGQVAKMGGLHADTVVIEPGSERLFEVVAES